MLKNFCVDCCLNVLVLNTLSLDLFHQRTTASKLFSVHQTLGALVVLLLSAISPAGNITSDKVEDAFVAGFVAGLGIVAMLRTTFDDLVLSLNTAAGLKQGSANFAATAAMAPEFCHCNAAEFLQTFAHDATPGMMT